MKDFFRKEALESFSSRSGMHKGVSAVNVRINVLVALLAVCAAVFAIWLVFGTVYETVSVSGIIWPSENTGEVYTEYGGVISKTVVAMGDAVKIGDILAIMPQEDILLKIQQGKERGVSDEELQKLYNEYDRHSIMRSNINGIVTYIADANSYIDAGGRVVAVVPYSENGNNRVLTAFIPSEKGRLVTSGMEAQVMPDFAPREKYGYIKAYVSEVSTYPVTGQSIRETNGTLFVSGLDERGSYLKIQITLIPDAESESRLKWSNPNSGKIDAEMGTVCDSDIIIRRCRPYERLF